LHDRVSGRPAGGAGTRLGDRRRRAGRDRSPRDDRDETVTERSSHRYLEGYPPRVVVIAIDAP
jgi:hypothetical protein